MLLGGVFGSDVVAILNGVELLGGVPPPTKVKLPSAPAPRKDIALLAGDGGVLVRMLMGLL